MTRYRFGRVVAGITAALALILAVLAAVALAVVIVQASKDRASLSLVVPLGGCLFGGLGLAVLSSAAVALFDLADRALGS